jgi:hypothetical protein
MEPANDSSELDAETILFISVEIKEKGESTIIKITIPDSNFQTIETLPSFLIKFRLSPRDENNKRNCIR